MLSADYEKIPLTTIESLHQYIDHHLPVGGFLSSVLSNNLVDAFARADSNNQSALLELITYCHWEIPSQCWGSEEKVRNWLNHEDTIGHTHTHRLSQ